MRMLRGSGGRLSVFKVASVILFAIAIILAAVGVMYVKGFKNGWCLGALICAALIFVCLGLQSAADSRWVASRVYAIVGVLFVFAACACGFGIIQKAKSADTIVQTKEAEKPSEKPIEDNDQSTDDEEDRSVEDANAQDLADMSAGQLKALNPGDAVIVNGMQQAYLGSDDKGNMQFGAVGTVTDKKALKGLQKDYDWDVDLSEKTLKKEYGKLLKYRRFLPYSMSGIYAPHTKSYVEKRRGIYGAHDGVSTRMPYKAGADEQQLIQKFWKELRKRFNQEMVIAHQFAQAYKSIEALYKANPEIAQFLKDRNQLYKKADNGNFNAGNTALIGSVGDKESKYYGEVWMKYTASLDNLAMFRILEEHFALEGFQRMSFGDSYHLDGDYDCNTRSVKTKGNITAVCAIFRCRDAEGNILASIYVRVKDCGIMGNSDPYIRTATVKKVAAANPGKKPGKVIVTIDEPDPPPPPPKPVPEREKDQSKNDSKKNTGDSDKEKDKSKDVSKKNTGKSDKKKDESEDDSKKNTGKDDKKKDESKDESNKNTGSAGSSNRVPRPVPDEEQTNPKTEGQDKEANNSTNDINKGGTGPYEDPDGIGKAEPPEAVDNRDSETHNRDDETEQKREENNNGSTIDKIDNRPAGSSSGTTQNPEYEFNKPVVNETPDKAEDHDEQVVTDQNTGEKFDKADETEDITIAPPM